MPITFTKLQQGGYKVFPPGPCGQLRDLPDTYVDLVLTSPAYNLGSKTYRDNLPPEQYWSEIRDMFKGVRRVLKLDGICAVDVAETFEWAEQTIDAVGEFTRLAREAGLRRLDRAQNYHYSSTSSKEPHGHSPAQCLLLFTREDATKAGKQLPPRNPFRHQYEFGLGRHPEEWWPSDLVDDLISVFCPDLRQKETTPILLDPFMGSGILGLRACKVGWRFIGYEREAKHCSHFEKLAHFEFGAEFHALEESLDKQLRSLKDSRAIPKSLDLYYIGAFLYDHDGSVVPHRVDQYLDDSAGNKRRADLYEQALAEIVPITNILPAIQKIRDSQEIHCLVSRYDNGNDYIINRSSRHPIGEFFRLFNIVSEQEESFLRHFDVLREEREGAFFAFFPVPQRGYPGGKILTYLTVTGAPFCEEVAHSFRNTIVQCFLNSAMDSVMTRVETLAREAQIHATRAASAAILARNMSHHMGSHVTPRTQLDDLRARVEELILPVFRGKETSIPAQRLLAPTWAWDGQETGKAPLDSEEFFSMLGRRKPPLRWQFDDWRDRAFPILQKLRDTLDDYVQRKSEFIAEFSTDPLISTRGAWLYRDVILPFIRNTALTDTLAANEGFRYRSDAQPGIVVRCFVMQPGKAQSEPQEITVTFQPERIAEDLNGPQRWRYPPYGMRYAGYPSQEVDPDSTNARDLRVALPGPVGEMAFYGILENIIRNAAKHGGRRDSETASNRSAGADSWKPLEVHVVLHDAEDDSDFYLVEVYENLSEAHDQLVEALQKCIGESIVDAIGQPRLEAWGMAEMVLCAGILRGVRPGSGEAHGLTVKDLNEAKAVEPFIGEKGLAANRLVYSFAIRKACTAAFFGFGDSDVAPNVRNALATKGFRFEDGSTLFADASEGEIPPAFQFAVLHARIFDRFLEQENPDAAIRRAFKRLPFRALVCDEPREGVVKKTLSELRVCGSDTPPFPAERGADNCLTEWLWRTWIGWLKRLKGTTQAVALDLYFHQSAGNRPTSLWAEHAEAFSERHKYKEFAPAIRVWAHSACGPLECVTTKAHKHEPGDLRVVVDRHGKVVSDDMIERPSPHDCIMVIDKASSDFDALYNATFDDPWQLPYELAEAGLLRILVIDERIAQRADDWFPAIEKARPAFQRAMTGNENEQPRLHHVSERAGVFIATHLEVVGATPSGKGRDARLDLARREWHAIPNASSATESSRERVLRFDLASPGVSFGDRELDLVVLHQGIVDLVKDRYSYTAGGKLVAEISRRYWTVIESGRGIPPEVQQSGEKFLSFSLIDHAFQGKRVAKLGLVRQLMEVTRNRTQ